MIQTALWARDMAQDLTPPLVAREFLIMLHRATLDLAFIPRARGEFNSAVRIEILHDEFKGSLASLASRLILAAGHLAQAIEDGEVYEWQHAWQPSGLSSGRERYGDIELLYWQEYRVTDDMVLFAFQARKVRQPTLKDAYQIIP